MRQAVPCSPGTRFYTSNQGSIMMTMLGWAPGNFDLRTAYETGNLNVTLDGLGVCIRSF